MSSFTHPYITPASHHRVLIPFIFQRKALVVLFHHWFGVAAEENASANSVSLYLGEVKKTTPPLLGFLVNLADDNGNTALHYSLSHCNYSIVSLLLETGTGRSLLLLWQCVCTKIPIVQPSTAFYQHKTFWGGNLFESNMNNECACYL